MKSKKYLIIPVIVLAAFLVQPVRSWAEERYSELQNFSKILNLVQQYYVDPVDTKKLIAGAIKGMLRELDPHTNFMPADIFKDFESETAGEFGGLGIEISVQNNILTIISPIEDTPAWKAGIKPGDRVVAIDGQSTKGFTLVEASALLKGKNGEPIVLSVIRDSTDKPLDIRIVRGQVKLKSVKAVQLDNGYLYVRVTSFIESTSKELEKVLADYSKSKKMEGILLDLRKNPGGLLEQAIRVSDLFIKEGAIVSTIGRDPKSKEVSSATRNAPYPDTPIVVLINEYSASASEIVAGALQDNKRAVIVGERSFGKGSVQSVIKLGDGSGLKLTVARYYTPSGVSIQSEGIKPDIEIEEVDSALFAKAITEKKYQREKDITGHLKSETEKKKTKVEKARETKDSMAWWKDLASKKDNDLTESEKLFKSDYQAYQAYSYLKAWKTLKKFN
ncbi:MAG: S41 family peptidase [Bdellovibrionaceae bacterium]|nr:S41 family peptidase [Pseudobdellovibrionaceae bacterium]